jgi:SARP family transcriptional regulator, regulator of embCAB operon
LWSCFFDPPAEVLVGDALEQLGVVGPHVLPDPLHHLVFALAAGHVPALAVDLLGHSWTSFGRIFVGARRWGYVGATLAPAVRIQLCGTLAVEIDGMRIDQWLPGRQGRLLLAYLVLHRLRPVRRDELVDALWPRTPPTAADAALRALISKLRRLLPENVLDGRTVLHLHLPPDTFVDLEHAREAIHRTESALAQGHWHRAWGASLGPLFTARRGFLPDEDADWIREVRHELDALYLRALECYAQACLGVGGTELAAAERCGRELTRLAPYRESGHRHLMRALAARGNTAEALRCYEHLRTLLREEL